MPFEVGQKYVSRARPAKYAEVLKVKENGARAFILIRDDHHTVLDQNWFMESEFSRWWAGFVPSGSA